MDHFSKTLIAGSVACLLSACASVQPPKDLGKLQYTGFTEKSDGTAFQSVMGLTCPETIGGTRRTSTYVYNGGGTDVSCNYSDGQQVFTTYFSRYPDDSLRGNFESARYAIQNRFDPQGFVFDEKLSDGCGGASLDAASLLSGLNGILAGSTKNNTITMSPTPSAVYINAAEGRMTLVVVDEMFPKEFFKTRYTGPYGSEGDVDAVCEMIRENYLSIKAVVSESRGIEVSDTEKMLSLIGNKNDDS
jgi:hypothetical protein